ncbi:hypothetical protein LMH87_002857 [Akanthomyces muscarius]|uniref:CFEM domain-containing protein n=1 Tax=Akanthomyces muscarius TaxID=2231603 RepID=A0A9W8Q8I6_AKAMU|nr:hypothetical protein LMH87_002857 [Akanthomyces muscarius]KAJ4148384.1 hypothetical protein LMH87_002857 [Akanthomyces muscarius]
MKFALPLLAAASLAAAQSGNPLNDIPKCAQDCVGKFLSGANIAGCSLVDYNCICSNEKFIDDIACCLDPVCDDKGKSDTIALANKLCKAFKVDLPTAVTCKSSAASSTAASGSATSSSDAGQTTSAASSGASSSSASSAGGSGAAASTSSSKTNAAPTNVAGIVGAAAALAFAL